MYSQGPSEQKPLKNLGEKGAGRIQGLPNFDRYRIYSGIARSSLRQHGSCTEVGLKSSQIIGEGKSRMVAGSTEGVETGEYLVVGPGRHTWLVAMHRRERPQTTGHGAVVGPAQSLTVIGDVKSWKQRRSCTPSASVTLDFMALYKFYSYLILQTP